jgi:hypothetical protein
MDIESGAYKPQPATPAPEVKPQPNTEEQSRAELDKALSRVNGELFETLARERGLPLAGRYLAAQVLATVHDDMLPALRDEIMAQLKPELEPLKQDRGFQQATQHVANLIEVVGQYKNQDGSDAFPELHDADTVMQVGELWRSLDLPPEVALTDKGLLQAIALFRMYNGLQGNQTAPSSTPKVTVSEPPNTAPRAATAALESSGVASPMTGRAGAESETTRFVRGLDDSDLIDKTLGFAVRRRR